MVIYSLWFPLDDLQTIGSAAWQRQNLALDHHGLERECAVALVGKSLDVGRVCSHVNCGKQCPQKHVPFSTQRASFSGLELAWIGFLQGAGLFWFGLFAVLVCLMYGLIRFGLMYFDAFWILVQAKQLQNCSTLQARQDGWTSECCKEKLLRGNDWSEAAEGACCDLLHLDSSYIIASCVCQELLKFFPH